MHPRVIMIAGPNGAGKTTLAYRTLLSSFAVNEFVNADEIARGLSPFNADGQSLMAGRLMLQQIDKLITARKNFAFETTGASHVFAEKLKKAKAAGFKIGLFYVWLPNADMAKERVRLRVIQGGHNIPETTIERRYNRGLVNLVRLYLPLADVADIYDGACVQLNRIIAEKRDDDFRIHVPDVWQSIVGLTKEDGGHASE